jgi:ABC-2 type transport system permease protein
MSTTAVTPQVVGAPAVARPGVTQARVARSEWTKLWSLRSTRWSLLTAVASMIGLGLIFAAAQMSRWASMTPEEHASFSPIDVGVGGWHLAQLAVGVLGVLVISGEYSTGMIRSSLMAVPRRLPVLWAKLGVFSAVTFVLMLAASLIGFLGAQAIVAGHHLDVTLSSPDALRTVVGTALFLTVLGALAVGLGALLRNTAGGIAAFVALLFVLPGIVALLPSSVGHAIEPYLPLNAGTTVATAHFDNAHHLSTWGGFAVFCGYTVLVIGAAAIRLVRRDA